MHFKKLNKNCFRILMILSSTQIAHAGFYLGAHMGLNRLSFDHTFTDATKPDSPIITKQPGTKFGLVYGGQLGYLITFNPQFFGFVEFVGTLGSANFKNDIFILDNKKQGSWTIKRSHAIGPFVGFGTKINPLVGIYIKGGYEWSSYNVKYTDLVFNGDTKNLEKNVKCSTMVPGIGLLYQPSSLFLIKIDYNYGIKKEVIIIDPKDPVEKRYTTFSPSEHRLTLSFNIHL